jgi:hypothetical protein
MKQEKLKVKSVSEEVDNLTRSFVFTPDKWNKDLIVKGNFVLLSFNCFYHHDPSKRFFWYQNFCNLPMRSFKETSCFFYFRSSLKVLVKKVELGKVWFTLPAQKPNFLSIRKEIKIPIGGDGSHIILPVIFQTFENYQHCYEQRYLQALESYVLKNIYNFQNLTSSENTKLWLDTKRHRLRNLKQNK